MSQVQWLCGALQQSTNLLITCTVIYLLVAKINCQRIYETSEVVVPEKPVQFHRGHELVVIVPKYNLKITATTKNEGHTEVQHSNGLCNCNSCSKACRAGYQQELDSHTQGASYDLVPAAEDAATVPVYLSEAATYQEPSHTPDTVFTIPKQVQSAYDPVVGSARSPVHKHKQNSWYYSAPAWMPESNANINILRSPDPRSVIQSQSNFVKVKNKPFGSSFVHHHSQSFVSTKPTIVRPIHVHKLGGLSIHKQTNVHVNKFRNDEEMTARAATRQVDNRFIGSHMFAAPRWRRDTVIRKKRGVLEFLRLVGDHEAKLDVSKTAENVGIATKNVFESDKSPMYHLRNMVGSSNDAVMSMIGTRPRGVLIPSRYRVVSANEAPIVGSINPGVYSQNGQVPNTDQNQDPNQDEQHAVDQYYDDQCQGRSMVANDDAFSRVGAIFRDSVQQTHKTAEHVADAVHSAREVVASARRYWPKMVLPYLGAVEVAKKGKGADIVGSAQDPQFVGIGRIMDYFGLAGVKPETEPRLGSPRHITEEEKLLNSAKASLGTTTYRQFMEKMKKELGNYQRRNPTLPNSEQVSSRLITRLPVRPRPFLPRIPRPVHKPLLLNANIHKMRTSLKLPPKSVLKLVRRRPSPDFSVLRESLKLPPKPDVKPSLANIRETLKIPPKLEVKTARIPKLHDSLLAVPKAKAKESPVLEKIREALKPPSKIERKPEKPVSPALAKLRESIALRKAAKKSPLLGKSRDVTESKDHDAENEVEPKADSKPGVNTSPDMDYTEEDLDKSETDPPKVGPQPKSITTSPNLDDSEETEKDSNVPVAAAQPKGVITSPNLDDSEENVDKLNIDKLNVDKINADKLNVDTKKDLNSPLHRLRTKFEDKFKKPTENTDHGDLLGRALEILRNKAKAKPKPMEEVGAVQEVTTPPANCNDTDNNLGSAHDAGEMKFAAIPVPIFTKEMKTPFMGFASKTDLDSYFKNLYCEGCKSARDADNSET